MTSSARASTSGAIVRSSADSMKRKALQLASRFHELLIDLLAKRLVLTDRLLKTLLN